LFRIYCIHNKRLFNNYLEVKKSFDKAKYYIIEICTQKCYIYNNNLVSHYTSFSVKDRFNKVRSWFKKENIDKLKLTYLTNQEMENNILEIKKELNKPFIIVSHFVTKNEGSRYELRCFLEKNM
jgi:hypothetical protein